MDKAKRKAIIAGNWKMNNTIVEGKNLVRGLAPLVKDAKVTVVVCPTATALAAVADAALGTNIHVGAQNVHWESHGAFTGEISTGMLNEIGVDYIYSTIRAKDDRAVIMIKVEDPEKAIEILKANDIRLVDTVELTSN